MSAVGPATRVPGAPGRGGAGLRAGPSGGVARAVETLGAGPAACSPESPGRLGSAPASAPRPGSSEGAGCVGRIEPETWPASPRADAPAGEKLCLDLLSPGDLSPGPQAEWKPGPEVTASRRQRATARAPGVGCWARQEPTLPPRLVP